MPLGYRGCNADDRRCADTVAVSGTVECANSFGCWARLVALGRALARVNRALGALNKYVALWLLELQRGKGAVILLSSAVDYYP
jgi:hypothetical protein